MGHAWRAGVALIALAGACGGRSRTAAGDEGTSEMPAAGGQAANAGGVAAIANGGAPSSAGAPALAGFTGNEVSVDTGEPQAEVGPNTGSGFVWAYGIGNWFFYAPPPNLTETDATIAAIVPPRGDSTRAYRALGSGEPNGVDLFAQLRHPDGTALDLSAYYGIGFWAKLSGTSESLVVALGSQPFAGPDLGGAPSASVVATTDWQAYELSFAEFGTDGSKVATVNFIVGADGGAYDLWVNDLALLCRGACPISAE